MRRLVASLAGLILCAHAAAAGPAVVAHADRADWTDRLDSPAAFDTASRAEILAFASGMLRAESEDADTTRQRLKLKQWNASSVARLKDRLWARLLANYGKASASCTADSRLCPPAADLAALRRAAAGLDASIPDKLTAWRGNEAQFDAQYLDELVRLAALFPDTTSEIDTFSANELTGDELADRHFLLTFDDGPSPAGGNTDKTLATLRTTGLNGTFYMLGSRLTDRVRADGASRIAASYAGMCAASHGWQHDSHAKIANWQESVDNTMNLLRGTFSEAYVPLFRPPYGQRRPDSGEFFASRGLKVALWNIDSQDWNNHVSADAAGDRVLTLMLLWRHGVILFHDIHPKAQVAVPRLARDLAGSGVTWMDCHGYLTR